MKKTILSLLFLCSVSAFASEATKLILTCNSATIEGNVTKNITVSISQRFNNGNPVIGFVGLPLYQAIVKKDGESIYSSNQVIFSKNNKSFHDGGVYFELESIGAYHSLFLQNRDEFGMPIGPWFNGLAVKCNINH